MSRPAYMYYFFMSLNNKYILLSSQKFWRIFVPGISCFCIISVSLFQEKTVFNVNI